MPEDAQIAESSAAVVEEPNDGTQQGTQVNTLMDSWTAAEQRTFMETGEMPSTPPKGQKPAPDAKTEAPAEADKADTKPPADPVAATKAENQARYKELLTERAQARTEATQRTQEAAQLRAKLAEYEGKAKPEPPAPDPAKPAFPKRSDFDNLDAYEQAMVEYSEALTDYKIGKAREGDKAQRESEQRAAENAEVLAGWESRASTAIETAQDPVEFEGAVAKAAEVLTDYPGIARYIMKNPLGPQMAAHLGRDPKALRTLVRISDAADLVEALGDLRNEVRAETSKPAGEPELTLPVKVTPISKAAAPPTQLSTAKSAPADEVQAAIESGNVAKYMALMNDRDLKQKRG